MLTNAQLVTMLQLQDRLNCVINPDWQAAHYPWHRAIMVEAVEALDHYGWKWWKKQEPDLAQARIELVDIWHFVLSMNYTNDVELAAEMLNSRCKLGSIAPAYNASAVTYKLDMLVGHAANGMFNAAAFISLMKDFELSWDQLYTTYIAKNVLNMFRQDHGYQAGSYRKDWNGVEDNVALDRLMAAKPDATPEQLYDKLEQVYARALEA